MYNLLLITGLYSISTRNVVSAQHEMALREERRTRIKFLKVGILYCQEKSDIEEEKNLPITLGFIFNIPQNSKKDSITYHQEKGKVPKESFELVQAHNKQRSSEDTPQSQFLHPFITPKSLYEILKAKIPMGCQHLFDRHILDVNDVSVQLLSMLSSPGEISLGMKPFILYCNSKVPRYKSENKLTNISKTFDQIFSCVEGYFEEEDDEFSSAKPTQWRIFAIVNMKEKAKTLQRGKIKHHEESTVLLVGRLKPSAVLPKIQLPHDKVEYCTTNRRLEIDVIDLDVISRPVCLIPVITETFPFNFQEAFQDQMLNANSSSGAGGSKAPTKSFTNRRFYIIRNPTEYGYEVIFNQETNGILCPTSTQQEEAEAALLGRTLLLKGGIADSSYRRQAELARDSLGVYYVLDQVVEGNYKRAGIWYPGHITRIIKNKQVGTMLYDILYDDSDQESDIDVKYIRAIYKIDDSIIVYNMGRKQWLPGKIIKKSKNNAYDIKYNSNDIQLEHNVSVENIRLINGNDMEDDNDEDDSDDEREKQELLEYDDTGNDLSDLEIE